MWGLSIEVNGGYGGNDVALKTIIPFDVSYSVY
jgi:hypothetical protein